MRILQQKDYSTFFPLFFFMIGWSSFSLLLTWSGLFYGAFFIVYILLFSASTWYLYTKKKYTIHCSKELILVSIGILAIASLLAIHFQPSTLFSGRDQGSLSSAAIELAQKHELTFSTSASQEFFKIYGPGKALNYPGFNYTQGGELITQFPLAYISWLASFYIIFGIYGIIFANAALLFLSLLSLYLLARNFIPIHLGLSFIVLLGTSFPIFWFSRFTLSENYALALLWTSILGFILFYKKRTLSSYALYLSSCSLLLFARIEGVIIFSISLTLLLFFERTRIFLFTKKWHRLILPLIFIAGAFIVNLVVNLPFFKTVGKAFFSSDANIARSTDSLTAMTGLLNDLPYLFNVYWIYGLGACLVIGLSSIIFFLIKKRRSILYFFPLIIILPVLVYLFHPFISSDHPWLLRRMAFAITPLFLFYSILLISELIITYKRNLIAYALLTILILSQLPVLFYFFPFIGDKALLKQVHAISEDTSSSDLILIDRLASGDGWAMLPGPLNSLFNRQAVYFFNPEDYNKIDIANFNSIYLLIPKKELSVYENTPLYDKMIFVRSYTFQVDRLDINTDKTTITWPKKDRTSHELLMYKLQ